MSGLEAGDTVFVRGAGGAIFEMDVPSTVHARELFDQQLTKGDLAIVPVAHWVERGDGSKYLVAGEPAEADAPKRTRKAKADPVVEVPSGDEADADPA